MENIDFYFMESFERDSVGSPRQIIVMCCGLSIIDPFLAGGS